MGAAAHTREAAGEQAVSRPPTRTTNNNSTSTNLKLLTVSGQGVHSLLDQAHAPRVGQGCSRLRPLRAPICIQDNRAAPRHMLNQLGEHPRVPAVPATQPQAGEAWGQMVGLIWALQQQILVGRQAGQLLQAADDRPQASAHLSPWKAQLPQVGQLHEHGPQIVFAHVCDLQAQPLKAAAQLGAAGQGSGQLACTTALYTAMEGQVPQRRGRTNCCCSCKGRKLSSKVLPLQVQAAQRWKPQRLLLHMGQEGLGPGSLGVLPHG